jgi:hypothetical protein
MFREAKQAVEKERGERLDEDAVLEALCRSFCPVYGHHVTRPRPTWE